MGKRIQVADRTRTPGSSRLSPLASFLLKRAAYGYEVVFMKAPLHEEFLSDAEKDKKPERFHILRKVVTVKVNEHDAVSVDFDQNKFKALVDAEDHHELCEVVLYLEGREVELWDALDEIGPDEYPSADCNPLAEGILDEVKALWNAS